MKEATLKEMMAKKPEKVVELAVKGMLPKGPLGREMYHETSRIRWSRARTCSSEARSINILIGMKEEITVANAKYYGTGRRKKSIARVYLVPGTGKDHNQ